MVQLVKVGRLMGARRGPYPTFFNVKASNTAGFKDALNNGGMILCAGDSTTFGIAAGVAQAASRALSWPDVLSGLLGSDAHCNAIMGFGQSPTTTDWAAYAANSGITSIVFSGAWGYSGTTLATVGGETMSCPNDTTNPVTITPSATFDQVDIYWVDQGSRGLKVYDQDDNLIETIVFTSTLLVKKQTVDMGSTCTALKLRANTTSSPQVVGVVFRTAASPKCEIVNSGRQGYKVSSWNTTTNNYSPRPAVISVDPAAAFVELTINDGRDTPVATYKTDYQSLIDAWKGAGINLCLVVGNPANPANQGSQAAQDAIMRAVFDLAALNDLPVINHRPAFGWTWSAAVSLGLMASDNNAHPITAGYAQKAATVKAFCDLVLAL